MDFNKLQQLNFFWGW